MKAGSRGWKKWRGERGRERRGRGGRWFSRLFFEMSNELQRGERNLEQGRIRAGWSTIKLHVYFTLYICINYT